MTMLRACLVGLAVVVATMASAPASAGWYQNPQFGYRIHFPPGWMVNEDPANSAVTAIKPGGSIQLAVQSFPLPAQVGSAAALAQVFTANIFGGFQVLEQEQDMLAGVPGLTVAYLGMDGGRQVVVGAFYMLRPPNGYVLYAMLDASRVQELADESDTIFETFQWLNGGGAGFPAAPQTATVPQGGMPEADAPDFAAADLEPIDLPDVIVSTARIRERPDVMAPSIDELDPGDEVHVLGRVKGTKWVMVAEDEDPLGYVLDRHLRNAGGGAAPQTAAAAPAQPAVATVPVKNVPAGIDFGHYYALVIGNTGYASFPGLVTADDDAKAVAALLRESYGYETQLILDATRNQIIDAIEGYREKLRSTDNLLIFYAGHGWLDTKAERGYWLPVDATPDSKANWVSNATITDSIKAMDARHVMIVADSCYSGTLTRGIKIKSRANDHFKRLAETKARVAMTSGGLEPVSDSGGGKHSAFAKAFIDALATNDGVLDGTELFKRIERPVKLNADQTPAYADIRKAGHEEGGDFLFVRRK